MAVVEILVDVCDSMGANVVNTVCEATAPHIQQLLGQG
jgi:hydroxymethylglutaryl-CoA reductase